MGAFIIVFLIFFFLFIVFLPNLVRIFPRVCSWFKKVISKISTWFIQLRPVSKVSVCFVVVLAIIFFSPTQRAHRKIKQAINLYYANPEIEIVEFGKLENGILIISCENFLSKKIPTNIKIMDCKYRIKKHNGWEWQYKTFVFKRGMKIDNNGGKWSSGVWCDAEDIVEAVAAPSVEDEPVECNANRSEWHTNNPFEGNEFNLSRRQKRKIQKATEEILSEINKSWNNICVVRDYNGGYVIRERHLVMEYWIYTHNSTWTEIDMPLH